MSALAYQMDTYLERNITEPTIEELQWKCSLVHVHAWLHTNPCYSGKTGFLLPEENICYLKGFYHWSLHQMQSIYLSAVTWIVGLVKVECLNWSILGCESSPACEYHSLCHSSTNDLESSNMQLLWCQSNNIKIIWYFSVILLFLWQYYWSITISRKYHFWQRKQPCATCFGCCDMQEKFYNYTILVDKRTRSGED